MTVELEYLGYAPDVGASETLGTIPSLGPNGTPRLDWFDGYGEMAEGWEGEWVSGEPEFHVTDGLATADTIASAYRAAKCVVAASEVWGQVGPKFNEFAWQRWFLRAGGPGTGNAYGVYLPQEGAPCEIGRFAGGVWTALKVTSQVFADYDWIALVALGGTLQLYRWVPGDTSWTLIDSVMDATYAAAGYIGIEGNGNATFADFGGGGLAPIAREQPVATGTVTPGATLAVTSGRWYCQTPSGYAYQWQSRRRLVGTFAPISGATASTYVISEADADDRLYRCAVTATNSYGSAASPSNYLPMTYSKPPWRPDNETLEIAFGYGPTDASPVFTDVSSRLLSCGVERSRSDELDRFDAGRWSGTLLNLDAALNPENSTSPYYPYVRPGTPLRYTVNGDVQFYGYTSGFPQSYPGVVGAEVTLQALDAMSLLSRRKFSGVTILPEELMGARFTRVLQTILGYPAGMCDIDTGTVTATETADLNGQNPLTHLQDMAREEGGRFFVSKAGLWTFRDRDATLLGLVNRIGTFENAAGGIYFRLAGDTIEHDETKILNSVTITGGGGGTATAESAASQSAYGECDLVETWGIADADAQIRADHLVYERGDPHLRIPALEILWARSECSALAIPIVDALEIGQRFGFAFQPRAAGSDEIAMDVIVDGIMIDSQPGEYHVSVQLTPADMSRYWLLEVTGFGELEQTTYLW